MLWFFLDPTGEYTMREKEMKGERERKSIR
jgi:hypothetical protein